MKKYAVKQRNKNNLWKLREKAFMLKNQMQNAKKCRKVWKMKQKRLILKSDGPNLIKKKTNEKKNRTKCKEVSKNMSRNEQKCGN